jgi:shikimate kinase
VSGTNVLLLLLQLQVERQVTSPPSGCGVNSSSSSSNSGVAAAAQQQLQQQQQQVAAVV